MEKEFAELDGLLESIIEKHNRELLQFARRLIPTLTADDLLQPNDFPLLETHPEFRYHEGVISGVLTVQAAFRAWIADRNIRQL